MIILQYLLLFFLLFFAACEKALEYEHTPFENQARLSVEKTGINVFRITMSIDSSTWNNSDLNGTVIYNIYRINSSGKTLIARKLPPSADSVYGGTYKYVNEFGGTDSLLFDSLSYIYDSVGNRNNTWIKYAVAVQYGVKNNGNGRFAGGVEGALVLVDARDARPVFRLDINNRAVSTVTPLVNFTGYFDIAGVDTLKVYRFSAIRSVDSVGAWIPRIANGGTNSLIFLRGTSESFLIDEATPVVKKSDGSVHFVFANSEGINRYDTTLYGSIGRVDAVPRSQWRSYFDSFFVDSDSTAFFSKKDTLLEGLGRKIILVVPASIDTTVSLWAPMYDDIAIRDYIGDIIVDLDQMGSKVGIDNVNRLAYILSDDIKFKFNAYGDSSFYNQELHVWLITRNICSRVFTEDKDQNDNIFKIDLKSSPLVISNVPFADGTTGTFYDALLETEPVTLTIGASTIVRSVLNVNDSANYRVSPFFGRCSTRTIKLDTITKKLDTTFSAGDVATLDELKYYEDTKILSRVVKPGSFFGYSEHDVDKFAKGNYVSFGSSNSLSSAEWFGIKLNDKKIRKTIGWYQVKSTYSSLSSISNNWLVNFPTYQKSYQKKEYYHNPLRNIPSQILSQYFKESAPEGKSRFFSGKEFVLVALSRGRYFKEPRVFISAFSAPLKYVWDKTPPHISWTKNHDPFISEIYAPMYYNAGAATSSKITTLSALNNVFDVHLKIDDAKDGILSGIRDLGYGNITSVRLIFHYKTDAYSENPVNGQRTYLDGSVPISYSLKAGDLASIGSIITRVSFTGIDARDWRKGFWDMWVETADDLGNRGLAPFGGATTINAAAGRISIRTIEIK